MALLSPAELAQQVGEPYTLHYRASVRTDVDELAGRLGVRIVRDGDRLVRV